MLLDYSLQVEEEEGEDSISSYTQSESGVEEEDLGVEGEYGEAAVRFTWSSEVVFYEFLEEHWELSPRLEKERRQGVR